MKPVRRGLSKRGPGKHDGLVDKDRRQAVVAEAEKPAFQVWFRVEHGELDEQPCGPEERNKSANRSRKRCMRRQFGRAEKR